LPAVDFRHEHRHEHQPHGRQSVERVC
jgi:hypothetical protein